ncbi:uncharacterized protein [Paramisgurnus dabryanus]|uniref:uncharacterized protein n=1 Tax=Paramisgurnus dabryanus TaxID=90735 RepID=UPI0031F42305
MFSRPDKIRVKLELCQILIDNTTQSAELSKKMFLVLIFYSLCFRCPVDVFGDEVKSVSVMEGDSVTLHTDIKLQTADVIEWRFGDKGIRIARINKTANIVRINDTVLDGRFRDRLQADAQTGDLTITNITTQHTGLYDVTNRKTPNIPYRFNVTVYAPLPVPVITRDSSQCSLLSLSSNCLLLCSVLNVRDVSLSWYKGNSLLSSISVSDLNIRLSLHLEVENQDNNTYSCVLNNTITNQTQHLNITQLCQPCSSLLYYISGAAAGSLMIVAAISMFCICRKHKDTHQEVQTGEDEITYADTTFHKRKMHKSIPAEDSNVVYGEVKKR